MEKLTRKDLEELRRACRACAHCGHAFVPQYKDAVVCEVCIEQVTTPGWEEERKGVEHDH